MLSRKHLQQHYCKDILLYKINDPEWCGCPQIIKGDKIESKMLMNVRATMQLLEWHSLELQYVGYLNWIRLYWHHCFSHATAQTASLWPFTVESQAQFHVSPWGFCDGQSSTGSGLSPSISVFHHLYHSTSAAYSFFHLAPIPYKLNKWPHH